MKPWQFLVFGAAIAGALWLGVLLFLPQTMQPDWPGPLADGNVYAGGDAAELTVEVRQEGCCYVEGSLQFLELEGPWSGEWQATERQTLKLRPGAYELSAYERVCNGSCSPGFVDAPDGRCSVELDLQNGAATEVVVTFPIPQECTIRIVTGG